MKHLLTIAAVAIACFSARAVVPPPDKLLPSDILAVFTITDYSKARADWDRSPLLKFWQDAAMKAFRDKFYEKLKNDVVEPLEREFGVDFSDYKDLAHGQITVALTRGPVNARGEPTVGLLFLVDAREKSDVLKTNLATLKQKWIEKGRSIKPEKIRDIEFTTLVFSSQDGSNITEIVENILPPSKKDKGEVQENKSSDTHEWLVGQSESLLIVGTSSKDVEKVLVRQSGGGVPSLSEHGPFVANYGSLFKDSLTYAWVDLKNVLSAGPRPPNPDQTAETGPTAESRFMSVLGLAGLQSLAANLNQSNEGCLLTTTISAPEASRRGIVRGLTHQAREANPPHFVPADAVKFTRWRIDFPKAWAALESTLVDLDPAYASVIKLFMENAGKDQDPNFDLRKNLIANLGDDLIIYEKKPKEPTFEAIERPPTLYLVSSPRAEQLAAAVKALTAFLPQPSRFKEREFLGRKVFTVNLPSTPERQGRGRPSGGRRRQERVLSYTASGSYVAFSTDASLLEEYLRANETRSLAETPGLTQAAERVGGMGTGLFGFENQQESMRVRFEALKKQSVSIDELLSHSRLGGKLVSDGQNRLKDWADFSLLPEFDQVAKYFHIAVWAGAVTTDGITFKWFAPTPPSRK
jgi:hypothetical protein